MSITVPSRWQGYRFTGDSALFTIAGSTLAAPHTVAIRRAEPSPGVLPSATYGQMSIRYSGVVELATTPISVASAKDAITLEVRRVPASSGVQLKADLAELAVLLADPTWVDNLVDDMLVPCNC